MQTNPLQIPGSTFILNNPITGSGQNVLDSLQFYFPAAAAQAGLTVATIEGFAANTAKDLATPPKRKPANLAQFSNYKWDNYDYFVPKNYLGSLLNCPTYGTLEFGNIDAASSNGNTYTGIDGKQYTFQNMIFAVAIIDAKQTKNIVKTKITGRDGEVKEYIGMNDWAITISSVIDLPPDQAPLSFLQAFIQMLTAQVTIPVKNYYLNALGISNIVIEDVDLGQVEGGYSSQPIKITACSDVPLTDFLP